MTLGLEFTGKCGITCWIWCRFQSLALHFPRFRLHPFMKLLITLLLGMVYGTTLTAEERHPNIILVLADDLGA